MLLLGPGCCECLVTDSCCHAVPCSCQWGYGGPDCSMLKLPACRQSDEPWAPVHTGWMPKACECYRQAAAHIEVCGGGHEEKICSSIGACGPALTWSLCGSCQASDAY